MVYLYGSFTQNERYMFILHVCRLLFILSDIEYVCIALSQLNIIPKLSTLFRKKVETKFDEYCFSFFLPPKFVYEIINHPNLQLTISTYSMYCMTMVKWFRENTNYLMIAKLHKLNYRLYLATMVSQHIFRA